MNRFIIKNQEGELFRLLGFTIMFDKFHEPFLKVVFPDFKNGSCVAMPEKSDGSKTIQEVYRDGFFAKKEPGLCEFTYHFVNGVSHFKSKNQHKLQIKNQLRLADAQPIHILTLFLFDLSQFKKYQPSKIKAGRDYTLERPFNDNGMVFDLYLSKIDSQPKVKSTHDAKVLDHHLFAEESAGLKLTICEAFFAQKPKEAVGASIFRRHDPATAINIS